MSYDISQPVSQGSSGEETAENRRIHEIADELRRRCQLYEAQLRDSQDNVGRFEVEQRVAEQFAIPIFAYFFLLFFLIIGLTFCCFFHFVAAMISFIC